MTYSAERSFNVHIVIGYIWTIILVVSVAESQRMDDIMIPEFGKEAVRIRDEGRVKSILKDFISKGKEGLQVVADFDRTITRYKHNGKLVPTCHNVINANEMMTPSYREKARGLYLKYYPIEVDQGLTVEEKTPHMIEWWTMEHELITSSGLSQSSLKEMISNTDIKLRWTKAHELITSSGLSQSALKEMISNAADIKLREGSSTMFAALHDHQVPLLIFSAGVGDVIDGILRHRSEFYDNMKIVSNFMDFSQEGKVIGFKEDIIHIYNKNEGAIRESDYFKSLESRKNVLLLGDSVGDLSMASGVEGGNILKIGFLNEDIDNRLKNYMNLYDVVLVEDETMDVANAILNKVLQQTADPKYDEL